MQKLTEQQKASVNASLASFMRRQQVEREREARRNGVRLVSSAKVVPVNRQVDQRLGLGGPPLPKTRWDVV